MTLRLGQKLLVEGLELELVTDELLRLVGTVSTTTAQDEFRRVLLGLHQKLAAQKCASFTVDVRALNFVASSAVRVFIDWIQRAAHAGYKLTFRTDPRTTWHRLSFSVLKSLAPDTVDIV
jgi:hypothetical protein